MAGVVLPQHTHYANYNPSADTCPLRDVVLSAGRHLAIVSRQQVICRPLDHRKRVARLPHPVPWRHARSNFAQRDDNLAQRKDGGTHHHRIRRLPDGRGQGRRPRERPQLLLDGVRPRGKGRLCIHTHEETTGHLQELLHPATVLSGLWWQLQQDDPLPPIPGGGQPRRRILSRAGHPAGIHRRGTSKCAQPVATHPHRSRWHTNPLLHRRGMPCGLPRSTTFDQRMVRRAYHLEPPASHKLFLSYRTPLRITSHGNYLALDRTSYRRYYCRAFRRSFRKRQGATQ